MEEAACTTSPYDDDEPTLVFRRSEAPPEEVVSVSEGEPCGMLAFLCTDDPKSSLSAS